MIKTIKKYGDTAIVGFNKNDLKDYDLSIGDKVEITKINSFSNNFAKAEFEDKQQINWEELKEKVENDNC